MQDKRGQRWWWGISVFVPLAVGTSLAALLHEGFPAAMAYVAWMFATGQAFWAGYSKRQLDDNR